MDLLFHQTPKGLVQQTNMKRGYERIFDFDIMTHSLQLSTGKSRLDP